MSSLTWKIVLSRSLLWWLLFLQVRVGTVLLAFPLISRLYDLVQGNFSIFLAWWDFLYTVSNWNIRPCHAHGLYGSSNTIPITLVGISFHFLWPLQIRIVLDLHKHLFKQHVQGRVLLTPCWKACLLVVSIFLLSRPCLLWMRTLLKMAWEIYFHTLNSLPLLSYNCIFCIHEVLCWMDKFSHGLRLLLIKLMDE